MRLVFKILFLLLGLQIVCSPCAGAKDYHLKIDDRSNLDLCGNRFEKEVLVSPSMGKIERSDSLFGFDFRINFDPEVVRMNQALYVNTLCEFFEFKNVEFNNKEGYIIVSAGTVGQTPVASDRPLVAFSGNFIGACDEEVTFEYEYFEPTYEFTGTISDTSSVIIQGVIDDEEDRLLKINNLDTSVNEVKKGTDLTIPLFVDLGIEDNLKYLRLTSEIDSDSLEIESVSISNNAEVNSVEINNNFAELELENIDGNTFNLNFVISSSKLLGSDQNIDIKVEEYSDCACITNVENLTLNIKNLKTEGINSVEEKTVSSFNFDGNLIASKVNDLRLEVYSIQGNLIDEKKCYLNEIYDTAALGKGVYFIKVTHSMSTEILKIININFYN